MKDSVRCALVCVCVAVLVCVGECIARPQATSAAQQKLEQRVLAALEAGSQRGPAVKWYWDNWGSGPTCVDYRNLTLVDLPKDTESIRQTLVTLQNAMENAVCSLNIEGKTPKTKNNACDSQHHFPNPTRNRQHNTKTSSVLRSASRTTGRCSSLARQGPQRRATCCGPPSTPSSRSAPSQRSSLRVCNSPLNRDTYSDQTHTTLGCYLHNSDDDGAGRRGRAAGD